MRRLPAIAVTAVLALLLSAAKPVFRAPIDTLEWSADGSRVVAAGKFGPVVVMTTDGKGKIVADSLGQPRLSPDGRWVVGTEEAGFVAVEIATGAREPIASAAERGRPVRYLRSPNGDVMLLKGSVHHEIIRMGPRVEKGEPEGQKNFVDLWTDPKDPLVYVDTGYGLEVHHQWSGVLLRSYDSGRREQRYVDGVRDADGRLILALRDLDGFRTWTPPDPPGSTWDLPAEASVSLAGTGTWVAVGTAEGVEVRSTINQELLARFATKEPVVAVAASPAGDAVAAALESGAVKVFDTGKVSAGSPVDRAVVDTDTGRIRSDRLTEERPAPRPPERRLAMPGSTTALAWAPNGWVSGWVGQRFVELDPSGKEFAPTVPLMPGRPYAFSADGSVLAGVTKTGVVLVDTRNPAKWKVLKEVPSGGGHQQLQWNGPTLVLDDGSGKARAWDPVHQSAFGETYATSPDVTARFVQSPNGAMVAVTGKVPLLLDARTGSRLAELAGHWGGVTATAWSADGGRLATAGADGTVLVWDTGSLTPLLLVEGGHATRMVWSPDGGRLLAASSNGGVVIDTATGGIVELLSFEGLLEAVAWSANGRMMADNTGNVSFWGP